jgi:acetyl esterase/lipase
MPHNVHLIQRTKTLNQCTLTKQKYEQIETHHITPAQPKPQKIIIYLHGGAYIGGPLKAHWDFVSKFCQQSGTKTILVKYRKAPEHSYKQTHADIKKVYSTLLKKYKSKDIYLMGDSAGGGLALAFTMTLRDQKKPLPGKLILLSPWLDISMQNSLKPAEKFEIMASLPGLINAGKMYAKNLNKTNYLVSPLYGNTDHLPPTAIFTGTHDFTVFDCRILKKKLLKSKIPLIYSEKPKMIHVYVAFHFLPEAKQTIKQIIKFINQP